MRRDLLAGVHIDRYTKLYIRLNKIHDVIFNAVCGTRTGCASVQRVDEAAAETSCEFVRSWYRRMRKAGAMASKNEV